MLDSPINQPNARWGSLYDALYGTDAIGDEGGAKYTTSYNPIRGEKAIPYAKELLDQVVPLSIYSHKDVE